MFRRIESPRLFDGPVAQQSVAFDPRGSVPEAEAAFGMRVPDDLQRAVRSRQIEFLAGRFCCRQALCALGYGDASTEVGRDANRAPLWPPGVVGSITHGAGVASAALALRETCYGVGVDTEAVLSAKVAGEIGHEISTSEELAELARSSGFAPELCVTLAFSARESLFKCLYPSVQRFFGFKDASVVEADWQQRRLKLRLNTNLSARFSSGHCLDVRFELDAARVHTGTMLNAE